MSTFLNLLLDLFVVVLQKFIIDLFNIFSMSVERLGWWSDMAAVGSRVY